MKLDFRRRRKDGRLAKKPGPKPKKFKTDVPHRTRADVEARFPVHVSLRVIPEVARLRTRKAYQAVRGALRLCAAQGFEVSVAKRMNKALGRKPMDRGASIRGRARSSSMAGRRRMAMRRRRSRCRW